MGFFFVLSYKALLISHITDSEAICGLYKCHRLAKRSEIFMAIVSKH